MKDGTKFRSEGTDEEKGVSPVIGVILMVAITVLVAATVGALLTGSALVGQGVEEPATGAVTFNYDYDASSDMMRVSVTDPGNLERLYIGNRNGGFDDGDIVKATGGFGEAMKLLGEIGVGVFKAIGENGGELLRLGIMAAIAKIEQGFHLMLANIKEGLAEVLNKIETLKESGEYAVDETSSDYSSVDFDELN